MCKRARAGRFLVSGTYATTKKKNKISINIIVNVSTVFGTDIHDDAHHTSWRGAEVTNEQKLNAYKRFRELLERFYTSMYTYYVYM